MPRDATVADSPLVRERQMRERSEKPALATGAPVPEGGRGVKSAGKKPLPRWRVYWRLTLLLALLLCLVGLAGIEVDQELQYALRPPTAADEASAVCDYLLSRNYDALAGEIDPAPDGASTGPFDRAAFAAQLRTLDRDLGTVRTCTLLELGAGNNSSVVYSLTVHRTRAAEPRGSLVVVRRQAHGEWAISRASTFYYEAPL